MLNLGALSVRKRADQTRSTADDRFRVLIENASDIIMVLDADGIIVYHSPSAGRILGYSEQEIDGRSAFDFVHPEDLGRAVNAFMGVANQPGSTSILAEIRLKHKDGFWRPFELVGTNLLDDPCVAGVVVNARDISERKHMEKALGESEERFRALVDKAPGGIAQLAPDGEYLFANPALCELLGYTAEELKKRRFQDVTHPQDLEENLRLARRLLTGEQDSFQLETRYLRKDGSAVWANVTNLLIRDTEGEPKYVICIVNNISERRSLEEQLYFSQKMEAVGRLAGGIAHDFNNLLTAISGYASLLLEDPQIAASYAEDLGEILRAADRAASLTRQLLAFSRRETLHPAVISLNRVVRNMQKLLRRVLGEDIELVTELEPSLWLVEVDPGQIEQVIMNLALNARDAMPGGGTLVIETRNVDLDAKYVLEHSPVKPGPYVLVAMSDNGHGMDPETLSHIFEPFFTTKELGKGTGLGLSTVYGIVKQSGGNIWVYSEPGKGSTFKIYLPRVEGATDSVCTPEETSESDSAGSETIVIVEDEASVRTFTARTLQEHGYEVYEAADAGEALKHCRSCRRPLHLVLSDVVLPGMTGRELVRELRQLRPNARILFMSGYPESAVVRDGLLEEGAVFLEKPFTSEALLRKVREVLDGSPL